MPVENDAHEAIRGLVEELKNVLGEKTFKLPSVRRAMAVLAQAAKERDGMKS
jgi:hypothetical protein